MMQNVSDREAFAPARKALLSIHFLESLASASAALKFFSIGIAVIPWFGLQLAVCSQKAKG